LYQVEKVFIGLLMPVQALGFYMVPFNLAFKLTGIATAFGTALFPAMSSLLTLGRSVEALALFQRAQRYLVLLLLPPFAFVLATAPECLMVWIGADFAERGGGPLRLLAVAFFFHVLSALDATVLDAAGRPEVNTALFTFGACVNLLIAAPLVYSFGVYGAATALLLSMLVLAISLWRATQSMGLAPALGKRIWTAFVRPMSLMVPITLALYVVTPRLSSLPALLLAAGGFVALAYAGLALVGLDAAECRRVHLTVEQLKGSLVRAWLARVPKDV
jgi:O-antigen/teichoic acid export membrane protein